MKHIVAPLLLLLSIALNLLSCDGLDENYFEAVTAYEKTIAKERT